MRIERITFLILITCTASVLSGCGRTTQSLPVATVSGVQPAKVDVISPEVQTPVSSSSSAETSTPPVAVEAPQKLSGALGNSARSSEVPVPIEPVKVSGVPTSAAEEATRAAAQSGNLYCPFNDECSPSLVMISVVSEKGLERCSGVLISDTEVMTNDHCVDKSISLKDIQDQHKNLPCKDFIYVHFAGSTRGSPGPTAGCASVEVRSGETGIASVDYSIIKLDQSMKDRSPQKLARRGFIANEKASIYRVQMTAAGLQSGYDGMQSKLDCVASHSTFLYPAAASMDSTLMTFGNCPIEPGNSGSAVLNENGELGAIIQGYLTVADDAEIVSDLNRNLLDGPPGEVAIGTQVQCMPDVGGNRAAVCTPIQDMGRMLPSQYIQSYGAFSEKSLPTLPSGKKWIAARSNNVSQMNFFSQPVCTSEQKFTSSLMSYHKGMNRFMQSEWRAISELNEQKVVFSFNQNFGRSGVSRTFSNPSYGDLQVKACGNILSRND